MTPSPHEVSLARDDDVKRKKTPKKATCAAPEKKKRKPPPPRRRQPLSGYNIFFIYERNRILNARRASSSSDKNGREMDIPRRKCRNISAEKLRAIVLAREEETRRLARNGGRKHVKTHGAVSFAELSRLTSKNWKALDAEGRSPFNKLSQELFVEHFRSLEAEMKAKRRNGHGCGGEEAEVSVKDSMQVDDDSEKKSQQGSAPPPSLALQLPQALALKPILPSKEGSAAAMPPTPSGPISTPPATEESTGAFARKVSKREDEQRWGGLLQAVASCCREREQQTGALEAQSSTQLACVAHGEDLAEVGSGGCANGTWVGSARVEDDEDLVDQDEIEGFDDW